MRIAFYGGSFNPPHYAHFLAASWALSTGEVDQVWMVPSFDHPFGKKMVSYEDRLTMCKLGLGALSQVILVSDCEREFKTTYTVDTMEALCASYPEHSFRLLVGSDIVEESHKWKKFHRLAEISPLLLVPRGGYKSPHPLQFSLPLLSSSQVRTAIENQQDVHDSIPPAVLEYIQKRKLYLRDNF